MGNRTVTPTPSVSEEVERVAVALWVREAERAAPNVAKKRNAVTFHDQNDSDKGKWLDLAAAAIAALRPSSQPEEGEEVYADAFLVEWERNGEKWVHAHADEPAAVDQARKYGGTCTPLYRLARAAEVAQGVLYNVHEEALGDEACAAITALIEGEGG